VSKTENPSDYKKERLQFQIEWHSDKARHNKKMFRLYQIIILISGAIIPIVNAIDYADFQTRLISSIFGGLVVILTGLTQLEKYQDNWIMYRTSTELLKKEKYFFENNAGEYSSLGEDEKTKLLVERVESIVSAETSKYFTIHHPQQSEPTKDSK
jgi:hypothetical protein